MFAILIKSTLVYSLDELGSFDLDFCFALEYRDWLNLTSLYLNSYSFLRHAYYGDVLTLLPSLLRYIYNMSPPLSFKQVEKAEVKIYGI